jgi:hypothetical protein
MKKEKIKAEVVLTSLLHRFFLNTTAPKPNSNSVADSGDIIFDYIGFKFLVSFFHFLPKRVNEHSTTYPEA